MIAVEFGKALCVFARYPGFISHRKEGMVCVFENQARCFLGIITQ